jgi:hypothetical protein|tara:strand:- start:1110 stop:2075 length:966 start_codon:yes stop_codon:yes gene_type:complete
MGIKLLNKLMKQYATKAVKIINLSDLKGKSIVVDISIYLYKYKSQDMLLTNIFKLCSIINHYSIDAIFVFDGRPTQIKMETLSQRSKQKYIAKQKYYDIIDNYSEDYIKTNKSQLLELKKSFTRVKKEDIERIKQLLYDYGMKYYVAVNEADQICGKLVHSICKDGCLSDDMDMFVYKSKYVYRNLDIVNGTCLQYDLDMVLQSLNMNFDDFKWMCILSQNDYNLHTKNVFEYYKLYKTYYYEKQQQLHNYVTFIEYVMTKLFMLKKESDYLQKVYDMYNIPDNLFDKTGIVSSYMDTDKVYKLLEQDNFIYPPIPVVQAC